MNEAEGTVSIVQGQTKQTRYVTPIVTGILILAAGVVPWMVLAQINRTVRPDLPWSALVTLLYLTLLLLWLNGSGPPRRSAEERRQRLRLWPPNPDATAPSDGLPTIAIVALLAVLYVAWIGISLLAPIPELSAYPTTSYRLSMFIMGGVTAGVVEEVAFRGYIQSGIERHDRDRAIWITSLVFVFAHLSQGVGAVVLLGPGLFVASLLYGALARRTGTILPGIAIHVIGDLARTYFGVLRGDGSLLFVG